MLRAGAGHFLSHSFDGEAKTSISSREGAISSPVARLSKDAVADHVAAGAKEKKET